MFYLDRSNLAPLFQPFGKQSRIAKGYLWSKILTLKEYLPNIQEFICKFSRNWSHDSLLIQGGGHMNLNTLRELLTEEITKLKQTQPGRQFSVSAKDGAVINKSYVRRFAIRNKLEKYMFQKYTLSDKRKFECDICNKSFTLKCSLTTHQKQIHFSFLHTSDAANTY